MSKSRTHFKTLLKIPKPKSSREPAITETPLTAEAREVMLSKRFSDDLPHYGELFVPDDSFYIHANGRKQAHHMLVVLCHWLGIKPGYIGLRFGVSHVHIPDGQRYTIYLEDRVLDDEFLLGGVLAYLLTQYLIEERGQVQVANADRPALLATGSVVFGLGLVIMNGFLPTYGWIDSVKRWTKTLANFEPFSSDFKANYPYLLSGFLKTHSISPNLYSYSLAPWAAQKLGLKVTSKSSQAVREAYHKASLANIKLIGATWCILLVIGISGFTLFHRVRPLSTKTADAQERVAVLAKLTQDCKDTLAYERQYADLTDIQTVRSLNAVNLRCQSLNNQYQAAQQAVEHL